MHKSKKSFSTLSSFLTKSCLVAGLAIAGSNAAHSQEIVAANPMNVGRAIAGALQESLTARGFSAGGVRVQSTIARIGSSFSTVAVGAARVAVGVVTAPAWGTVALSAGIGTVVAYAIPLAVGSAYRWLFKEDTVDIETGATEPSDPPIPGIAKGGPYWSMGVPNSDLDHPDKGVILGSDPISLGQHGYSLWAALYSTPGSGTCTLNPHNPLLFTCASTEVDELGHPLLSRGGFYNVEGAPADCMFGHFFSDGLCTAYTDLDDGNTDVGSPPITDVPVVEAIAGIPAADLEKPVTPEIIAGLVNRGWQQAAATPGYDGLPFDRSNPVLPSDVSKWVEKNPGYAPTVGDFVAANPPTTAYPTPWVPPANPSVANPSPSIPNENTTNPGAGNPVVNLGPDPGIGAPTLESTPTAEQIIAPLKGFFPELKQFSIGQHSGECPKPAINVFQESFILSAHCELLDDNLALLQAACMVMFSLASLFIVLRA